MKTKYKHIHFANVGTGWSCRTNKDHEGLGFLYHEEHWNCFVFAPQPDTEYSADCLRDIVDFLEQLNRERKR